MINDKRKRPRRVMRYTAWIALDADKLHGCVLSDVSDGGARLDVENSEHIPDDFKLLLSRRGTPSRRCHVIWRTPDQLGVHFQLTRAAKAVRTKPKIQTAPEPEAAQSEPQS